MRRRADLQARRAGETASFPTDSLGRAKRRRQGGRRKLEFRSNTCVGKSRRLTVPELRRRPLDDEWKEGQTFEKRATDGPSRATTHVSE